MAVRHGHLDDPGPRPPLADPRPRRPPVRCVRLHRDEGLVRGFLGAKRASARKTVVLKDAEPKPLSEFDDVDDQGVESHMARIAPIVRVLPYAPFDTETFREVASRPVPGVDVPLPDDAWRHGGGPSVTP
jgi:hypothetical protein